MTMIIELTSTDADGKVGRVPQARPPRPWKQPWASWVGILVLGTLGSVVWLGSVLVGANLIMFAMAYQTLPPPPAVVSDTFCQVPVTDTPPLDILIVGPGAGPLCVQARARPSTVRRQVPIARPVTRCTAIVGATSLSIVGDRAGTPDDDARLCNGLKAVTS